MAILWQFDTGASAVPLAGATALSGTPNLGSVVTRSYLPAGGPSGGGAYRWDFLYNAGLNNAANGYGGEFYLGWWQDCAFVPANGASYFTRLYFKVSADSNFRAINSSDGSAANIQHKFCILADGYGNRTIIQLTGNEGTSTFNLSVGRNGEGNIWMNNLAVDTWYALQVRTITGTSGSLAAWLNTDAPASPTGTASGLNLTATAYNTIGWGYYNNRMVASNGVYAVTFGGFEYADTFDANWYANMGTGGGVSAPSFLSASSGTWVEGVSSAFTVVAQPSVTSIARTVGTLPTGITYVDHANGTGTLSGAPAFGSAGTYPQTFMALNSVGSTSQNYTLTVSAPAAGVYPPVVIVALQNQGIL